MEKQKNVKNYLVIKTDSYTGNFERELIAYILGVLPESHINSYRIYSQAFWFTEAGSGIYSLEDKQKCDEYLIQYFNNEEPDAKERFMKRQLEVLNISKEDAEKKYLKLKEKRELENYNNNLDRIYDTYLCYTNHKHYDRKEKTFFDICEFKGDTYESIYIQLNEAFSEHFEDMIIKRIKMFFDEDIYTEFEKYKYLCKGYKKEETPKINKFNLKGIYLLDADCQIIKTYMEEENEDC